MKPAEIYHSRLNHAYFRNVFDEYFSEGSAIGKDGTRVDAFLGRIDDEIEIAIRKIRLGTYQFTPYKEKLISKGASKPPRQISIPTIRDKLVLKFISTILADIYPEHVSQPPHRYIKEIHQESSLRPGSDYFLRLDIQSYFPSIDHAVLMRILRRKTRQKNLLSLIHNALSTPTGNKRDGSDPITRGVPQGLSISNILSSIYLGEIDDNLNSVGGLSYYRFVDDILIISDHSTAVEMSVDLPRLLKSKRKIHCHAVGEGSKSALISISEGIDYLGYFFREDQIWVRTASYKKMFVNLMKIFTVMKYRSNRGSLIWRLNLRISGCIFKNRKTGWLFFFIQSNSKRQLKRLDAFLVREAKKILPATEISRIKSFTKAYHEIRFNYQHSRYFPNFDNFDDAQKRAQIAILLPQKPANEINALTGEALDILFKKCISKEISELEKDMMEVFS